MQLVAYGAQDIYLTGNPQITFFKVVYRRHTNFSMETIQQTINGSSAITASDTTGNVTISRNGDLVSKVYVRCDQAVTAEKAIAGDKLIKEVEIEIGGQMIDRHYQEWLQVWSELTTPNSKASGYKYMTGGLSNTLLTGSAVNRTIGTTSNGPVGTGQQSIQVPLQFWFCRNPGLALPLIALQYHEVKLKFTWAGSSSGTGCARNDAASATPSVEVWCDYIYLDTDERRRFAQVSHEYLIEQLQKQTESGTTTSDIKLNFNHPVKELIWTNSDGKVTDEKAKLILNGHDRFAEQDREYFQLRQPFEYHTAIPGYNIKEVGTPQMLAAPIALTSETELDAATGADASAAGTISVTGSTGVVLFVSVTNPGTLYVGDVLTLSYPTTTTEQTCHTVQVTGVTQQWESSSTVCSITVNQTGANLANSTDGDGAGYIIARLQNPTSRCSQLDRNINVYSFALKPEEHQPSGTCNFSRIDNAKLTFTDALSTNVSAPGSETEGTDQTQQTINIYAVNYNVLRIMSGMGGLAYSN